MAHRIAYSPHVEVPGSRSGMGRKNYFTVSISTLSSILFSLLFFDKKKNTRKRKPRYNNIFSWNCICIDSDFWLHFCFVSIILFMQSLAFSSFLNLDYILFLSMFYFLASWCTVRKASVPKMMAVASAEKRPLKRQKLGPPDVYPQDAKQKEVQ